MRRFLLVLACLAGLTQPGKSQLLGVQKTSTPPAAPGAMITPILTAGSAAAPSTTVINYSRVAGGVTNNSWSTTATVATEAVWPVAGTISNISVYFFTAPGASASYDVGIVVNGTRTSLTCSIAGSSNSCTDSNAAHAQSVTAGSLVAWFVCPSTATNSLGCPTGASTAVPAGQTSAVQMSALFTSTANQEGFLISQNAAPSVSALNYGAFGNNATPNATEVIMAGVMPAAGVIDHLYVSPTNTPTTSMTIVVLKNGDTVPSGCTIGSTCNVSCKVTSTAQCTDLTGSITVAQGDSISIMFCPSGVTGTLATGPAITCPADGANPTSRNYYLGVRWTPTTTNQAVLLDTAGSGTLPTNSATRYGTTNGVGWSAVETTDWSVVPVIPAGKTMTFGNMTGVISTAPGAGLTRTINLRIGAGGAAAQSNASPSCTFSGTGSGAGITTCANGATATATTGQAVNFQSLVSATLAAVTWFRMGMTVTVQ